MASLSLIFIVVVCGFVSVFNVYTPLLRIRGNPFGIQWLNVETLVLQSAC